MKEEELRVSMDIVGLKAMFFDRLSSMASKIELEESGYRKVVKQLLEYWELLSVMDGKIIFMLEGKKELRELKGAEK